MAGSGVAGRREGTSGAFTMAGMIRTTPERIAGGRPFGGAELTQKEAGARG